MERSEVLETMGQQLAGDNLVDGLMRLMNTSDDVTGPINLGNPNEFSIRELAERSSP